MNFSQILEKKNLLTPCYFYDLGLLKETLNSAKVAADKRDYHIHYALKANTDDRVLEVVRDSGMGADCVSGNEVKAAIKAGFGKEKVVFAGVGKSDAEIRYALEQDIFSFNCESWPELVVINELAREMGKVAPVALRLNPNVPAKTHKYITTGLDENKFGMSPPELKTFFEEYKSLENIEFIGLHFHIGSQITDLDVFGNLCVKVNELQRWFMSKNFPVPHLNLGGGLGINYHSPDEEAVPDFESFFAVFERFLERWPGQQVHFELGRSLVAQCGTLLSRVLYVKENVKTRFLILDAGMTELIRPALYQSYHKIENITRSGEPVDAQYDVVGPVCESSDCFGKAVLLPETQRGDLIAIRSAGAYGEVMSSHYNLREREQTVYSE